MVRSESWSSCCYQGGGPAGKSEVPEPLAVGPQGRNLGRLSFESLIYKWGVNTALASEGAAGQEVIL